MEELIKGESSLAVSARKAQEASYGLSQLRSTKNLDPSGVKCPLTGQMIFGISGGLPDWASSICKISVGTQDTEPVMLLPREIDRPTLAHPCCMAMVQSQLAQTQY